jgi:hypothetical protein
MNGDRLGGPSAERGLFETQDLLVLNADHASNLVSDAAASDNRSGAVRPHLVHA